MEIGGIYVKVLLHGCNGKMGQVMTRVLAGSGDMDVVLGVDIEPDRIKNSYPVYRSFQDIPLELQDIPEVVVDFSHHTSLPGILAFGLQKRIPLVICTTGFTPQERQKMAEAAKHVPILNSANMSLGINLVLSLVQKAASVLGDSFDMEIIEMHHNQKADSPSGTALMIADVMKDTLEKAFNRETVYTYGRHTKTGKRDKGEIGIHAVRGGAVVGEHTIVFAGQGEVLEIRHSALSRDVFAYGTLQALRFIAGKGPGLYSMADVVEKVQA